MSVPNTEPVLLALIIADASSRRDDLHHALERNRGISVVGHATSLAEVAQLCPEAEPDVILVDLHLAGGASQAVIELIMSRWPRPILVLSGTAHDPPSASLARAMGAGAVEHFPPPALWTTGLEQELRHAVRQVSKVPVIRRTRGARRHVASQASTNARRLPVVAVAASTGGPRALATLLGGLGGLRAPVLVVQHLHADFTPGLVEWMTRDSALPVSTAVHGDLARAGRVYFASSGKHLRLASGGRLELGEDPLRLHRPSADELFQSVADQAGSAGIGVIMTGMGDDGARGLLAMHHRGAQTLAQDENTCAVFGMPRAARSIGAVTVLLPLDQLARAVLHATAEVLG